ncbi:hypothetical protein HYPSUDRAFT_151639 [Hypholoma sublateritium FD-334 SS-4]|uniref:Uncharacterized protein n=1 Tax=Hypholoma sublateritium (strain FD-334 SS-4) TaxID=945553 RepID=A0A0D2N2C7_HYPSF|nr:hypothetical protein HYPSUDRAFT_151639 [Hypholoma sublateritium FD-334 SS-4]
MYLTQVCRDSGFFSICSYPFIDSPQLQKGANDARSDDVRRIKEEIALWLNLAYAPNPPLNTKCRSDRGMQNDITGRLLCPIEYDWDDELVRNGIRAGTINISEDYFLRCFYPYGIGDPDNVEKGFLRSGLLVKTYSNIFISPSSSESFSDEDENGAARKQQRSSNSQKKATKCNVANILGMDGRVTPRSIAYAAVLLAFNLTDAGYWMEIYNQFNFRALYALIVDFFEGPSGQAAKRRSQNLLKWWSAYVILPDFIYMIFCLIFATDRFFLTIMVHPPTPASPGTNFWHKGQLGKKVYPFNKAVVYIFEYCTFRIN